MQTVELLDVVLAALRVEDVASVSTVDRTAALDGELSAMADRDNVKVERPPSALGSSLGITDKNYPMANHLAVNSCLKIPYISSQ